MKSVLVCYESQYGYSKQYAQWIAKKLDGRVMSMSEAKERDLEHADLVVAGGGLYAGKIGGAAFVKRHETALRGKLAAVFAVGLTPADEEMSGALLEKNFSPELRAQTKLFRLRGGMDCQKLKRMHRMMMKMFVNILKKKAPSERTADEQNMIDTYGNAVDFSDPASVAPLVDYVEHLR